MMNITASSAPPIRASSGTDGSSAAARAWTGACAIRNISIADISTTTSTLSGISDSEATTRPGRHQLDTIRGTIPRCAIARPRSQPAAWPVSQSSSRPATASRRRLSSISASASARKDSTSSTTARSRGIPRERR